MAKVTDPEILAQLNEEPVEAGAGVDSEPSVVADVGKQVAAGVPSALAEFGGFGGNVREGVASGAGWLAGKFGGDPERARDAASRGLRLASPVFMGPTSQQIKDVAHGVTGISLPEAETRPGKYARSVTEFAANPLSYVGPGSAVMKGMQAVSAGLGSEWLGGLFSGQAAEPYAKVVGAVGGALLPRAAMRAFTPLPTPQGRQSSVDILEAEGITPTAGQKSGSKSLRYMEGELGDTPFAGNAASREEERVGREFTNAVLARVGERWKPNERITDVVDRAHTNNGREFDRLARNTKSRYDNEYISDLADAKDKYEHLFVNPLSAPTVERAFEHATNKLVRSPYMDGAEYKALRSRLERLRRGTRDPEVQEYLAALRDAADNLVERHMGPGMADAWKNVRGQYRSLLVLDRVTTGAGAQAAHGNISPASLRGATKTVYGQRNYARGKGDFAELARAGEEILSPLPQSGTAPRAQAHRLASLFAGLGGAGGYAAGDVSTAIYGATAGAAVPAVMGRTLMSRPVQTYLRNQRMTKLLRDGPRQGSASLRAAVNARRHLAEEEDE